MSDDGRLPPSWGPPPVLHEPGALAGLFGDPAAQPVQPAHAAQALPPDPAVLAAQYQAEQEAAAEPPARSAGAHRAGRQPNPYAVRAIIGALAIVAAVVGLSGWFRDSGTGNGVAAPGATHATSSSGPTATSGSPSPTPSATTVSPSTHPTPTPTKPKPTPSRTTPTVVVPPLVHAPTVVLNETPTRGLAARVAGRLRGEGWTVTGTGNWHGDIGSTTVYYPRRLLAAARRLAYDLGVSRLRPVVPGMLTDRLTVVLTGDPFA